MNTQGIGLGLVISDNIVTTFGGKIGVKSKVGRGTMFSFSFVLGKDDDFEGNLFNQGIEIKYNSNRSVLNSSRIRHSNSNSSRNISSSNNN